MSRGKPFQPGNKYGRGRPPGSRNKRSLAQELLNEYEEPVIRKTLSMALQGNEEMLAALLPYVVPRRRDSPVKTGPLRTGNIEELTKTLEAIFKKVASGQLTLNEAREIASLLESRRRIMDTQELDLRLRTLESRCGIEGVPSATSPQKPVENQD